MKKTVISVATLTALAGTSLVNVNAEEVTVNSGDTLWGIANAVGTTVADLKSVNNLSSNLIHPGDVLSYDQSFKEETKQAPTQKAAKSVDAYTVKAGDTLWAIGNQFNVSYQSIMEANNLKSDLIFPGQKLSLKANNTVAEVVETEEVTEEKTTPVVEEVTATGAYVIQSGDTLYKISRETGVDVNTLKAINGLKSDLIFPGQVLALTGEVVKPKVEEVVEPAVEEETPVVEEVQPEVEEVVEPAVEEKTPVVEEVQPEVEEVVEPAVEEKTPVVEEVQPEVEVTEPVVDNSQVEAEREAAAQAERDRVAAAEEQAEADRLAAEQREQQKVAKQQAEEQKAAPPVVNTSTSSKPQQGSYGQNYYFHGDCTWYAFERRKELGKSVSNMWGNGNDWADNARGNGYTVNNTPSVGAIVHSYAGTNGSGGYGHVAVVESINPDGSITVSEMNWPTVGVKTTRTISAGNVSSHNFIH